jgi:hypothetical protein
MKRPKFKLDLNKKEREKLETYLDFNNITLTTLVTYLLREELEQNTFLYDQKESKR